MWLDENGQMIAGRKVEVIVEDSQGQPNVALTKLQKLVESDQVHVLVGEVFAHIGYAMAPKVDEYRIPMLYPVIAADDLTQRKPAKWVVRTGWASSQPSHPFGEYAAKTLGYKRIVTDRHRLRLRLGGRSAASRRPSRKTAGRSSRSSGRRSTPRTSRPYLSQIRRDADAVFALMVSISALALSQAVSGRRAEGEAPAHRRRHDVRRVRAAVARRRGDRRHERRSSTAPRSTRRSNKKFVTEYRKKYGKVPSYFSETCYTSTRWINEAAKAIGGDVENREKFLEALRKVEIPDAPRGPVKLDAYGNPIQNIYIRKVEKKDGELWNTVVHTYPAVSQFWKYKPEEFLKQPVYDRNFPPCKYC